MQRGALLLAAVACASATDLHEIARKVNALNQGKGWVAHVPPHFTDSEQTKKLCGTYLPGHRNYVDANIPVGKPRFAGMATPESFDAREKWSNSTCKSIHTVRDQSSCGSCWSFGSTETFEDRQCIHKGVNQMMSTEHTVACCHAGLSLGCGGGQPEAALRWMSQHGIVSGGLYGDKTTCQPYSLPPCAHHVPASAKYPKCPSSEYPTPHCPSSCQAGYPKSFDDDRHRGGRVYRVEGEENIKAALLEGPLSATLTVYEDFTTYKSGVYTHKTGRADGGHAVQMVGYGVENGQKYWWIKNSWNEQWGDNGYIKIARGHDECGIESGVSAIDFN